VLETKDILLSFLLVYGARFYIRSAGRAAVTDFTRAHSERDLLRERSYSAVMPATSDERINK